MENFQAKKPKNEGKLKYKYKISVLCRIKIRYKVIANIISKIMATNFITYK